MSIGNENDQVSKGHLVDALACTGDEGRGTLRKAMGSCEQALIRGFLNGKTHLRQLELRGRVGNHAVFGF